MSFAVPSLGSEHPAFNSREPILPMPASIVFRSWLIVCAIGGVLPPVQAAGMVGLLQMALEDNPVLRGQMRQIGAAQSELRGAQWQFFPTPSASVEQVSASSGDASFSRREGPVLTFRLQQPLWTGGRLQAGVSRAEASVAVAQAQLDESRQQVALRVISAWGEWKTGEQRRLALQESVETHERLAALIRRRVEHGLSAQADDVLAQARLEQVRAEATLAQAMQASARVRLEQLTGRKLTDPGLQALSVLPLEPLPALAPALEKAWSHSPTAARLQAQIRQQQMDLEIRKAQWLPEVYARAEHQQGSFNVGGPNSANRLFIGLSATTGAGLSAQSAVEAAAARVQALQSELEWGRRQLTEQLTLEHVLAHTQVQRRQSLEAGLGLSRDMVASWDRQFLAGRKTWVEVLNAARELSQAQTALAELRVTHVVSTWRLAVLVEGVQAVLAGQGLTPTKAP